jgi:putative endonuclease
VAARHLERLGYRLRERNYRCPHGEIDLIATEGEFLVFVEVKTRAPGSPLHPALSVTPRKRSRVRRVGEYYWARQAGPPLQPRFDVIAVYHEDGEQKIEHIVNAF